MIFDEWTNFPNYANLFPDVADAIFDFWKNATIDTSSGGRELCTSLARADVFDSRTNPEISKAVWETHHDYADIQTLLVGEEINFHRTPTGLTPKTEYNQQGDYQLFLPEGVDKSLRLFLKPGRFAIYLPGEPHLTSFAIGMESLPIRKIVFKIHKKFFIRPWPER